MKMKKRVFHCSKSAERWMKMKKNMDVGSVPFPLQNICRTLDEIFNRSRADNCLYVQDVRSAEDVSGEGEIQQIESRLFSVRTKCRIQQMIFPVKEETFNRSRPDYCQYVQDARSA